MSPAAVPPRALVLAQAEMLLAEEYGEGVVRCPAPSTGYRLLARMAKGTNAFTGSAKAKRAIASRPVGVYGRLRATRPGEFVLLDTNRLDVYAMETLTCRWVQAELSVACALLVSERRCTDIGAGVADRRACEAIMCLARCVVRQ